MAIEAVVKYKVGHREYSTIEDARHVVAVDAIYQFIKSTEKDKNHCGRSGEPEYSSYEMASYVVHHKAKLIQLLKEI